MAAVVRRHVPSTIVIAWRHTTAAMPPVTEFPSYAAGPLGGTSGAGGAGGAGALAAALDKRLSIAALRRPARMFFIPTISSRNIKTTTMPPTADSSITTAMLASG